MNKNYEYKKLCPFKWFVLQNFPFLDYDFDQITNWQLFQKLGEKINEIIESQNNLGQEMEQLVSAFNNLKDYVDNYFDNLDVQEEINKKLDEMVEDDTFKNILSQIINVNEKLYYYVEDYGAVGDGVTDDSQAINDAFLAAKNKKGTVAFKTQNSYLISSPIYIPQGCSLYGNGCTILSSVNGYAIYVNSTSEDSNTESVGRSFSILRHFNLESTNNDFIMGYNGIHFACHGIVQYINFYKIDKCVRFSHPLYIDKFKIEFCNASTRTESTNYAFDLGENGDAHEINNVQHTNTGSSLNSQPNFIHVGSYILNSKMTNIVGNGLIDIRGECDVSNIMLTYYGKINVQTSHKTITLKNVYASIDYIKNSRIHSNNNHILNLVNCRFISNYVQSQNLDNIGLPVTFENTDHVYVDQCAIGSRVDTNSSNYSTLDYEKIFGHDLVNPSIKNYNADYVKPFSTFSINNNIIGQLNGTFTYTQWIIFDKDRLIGKSATKTQTITVNNTGVKLTNNTIDIPLYIERQAQNNDKVSAYITSTNKTLYDQGSNISSIPWSNDLIDTSSLNTRFSKIIFNNNNVIAYYDYPFVAPNGTWTKNDIIIASDSINKYDGTNWITY